MLFSRRSNKQWTNVDEELKCQALDIANGRWIHPGKCRSFNPESNKLFWNPIVRWKLETTFIRTTYSSPSDTPNTEGTLIDNQLRGEDNYTQKCHKYLARFCWEGGKDPEKPPFTSPMAIRSWTEVQQRTLLRRLLHYVRYCWLRTPIFDTCVIQSQF